LNLDIAAKESQNDSLRGSIPKEKDGKRGKKK